MPASSSPPQPRANSGRRISAAFWVTLALVVMGFGAYMYSWLTFPSDKTPEGAYLRVVKAVNKGEPTLFFAYLEEPAQHACYTIRDFRKKSIERARATFPPAEFDKLDRKIGELGRAPDGADVFALVAKDEGWLSQLRRDVSGMKKVEVAGERATVETTKGSRYAFRRRPNGIWGMTAFTPLLTEEAERAARDHDLVEKSAADYAERKSDGAK